MTSTPDRYAEPPAELDWPALLAVAERLRISVWRANDDGLLEPVSIPTERNSA